MPANTERVLAGAKPRPKLWSLTERILCSQFRRIRLQADGRAARMRRVSLSRQGSTKPQTFYVHEERRAVHSIGDTRIVFSTKRCPTPEDALQRTETKVLLTNAQQLTTAEIVELYALRWQIELLFKELKSTLGMHQYRLRSMSSIGPWIEACCLTILYLEWIRLQHLRDTKAPSAEHAWWTRQRTHGLSLAVRQRLEEAQLRSIQSSTSTEWGIRKLRRLLRQALPPEYRNAA
jgi:Transposase DDE domain